MADYPLNEFTQKSSLGDSDFFFIISNGMPYAIPASLITSNTGASSWNGISNKPFDDLDLSYFRINTSMEDSTVIKTLSFNINAFKDLNQNWSSIENKPFDTIDDNYFNVTEIENPNNSEEQIKLFTLDIDSLKDTFLSFGNNTETQNYIQEEARNVLTDNDSKTYLSNGIMLAGLTYGASNGGYGYTINSVENNGLTCPYFVIDVIGDWTASKEYKIGYIAIYNNKIYKCLTANSDTQFDESKWQLLSGGGGEGIDFKSLSEAITGGTQTGINITADTENQLFNFEVTGLPTIAIDTNGYWTINGVTTTQKAQGENGTNSYTHIKYSVTEPTQNSDMKDTADAWIGIYSGSSETAPENYTDYTWYKIKGEDGITTVSATAVNLTGTLLADGWSDNAPYSQTISVAGLTDSSPIIDVILSNDSDTAEQEDTEWGYISKAVASTNSLTIVCLKNKPTIDLNIQIKVV